MFGRLARWLPKQPWCMEILKKNGVSDLGNSGHAAWLYLENLYHDRKISFGWPSDEEPFRLLDRKREPYWISFLPPSAQRYIRNNYAITDGIDQFAIVMNFLYTGFGYIIPDCGLVPAACDVFNLHRLIGIKQLGFLHDPVLRENDRHAMTTGFYHTRYCHVLDTYAIANLIAENVRLQERQKNTLLTAAISHDALTPAGGDSVKLIDPSVFDEDAHYPELLVGEEWNRYREQFGVIQGLLVETIMGQGLLGRILDAADKSAYTARDVDAYLMTPDPKKDFRNTHLYAIADIVEKDPNVCGIWESARVIKGSLVFADGERLARFMKLRALMFRGLYYNPHSRFFEYLIGKGVIKHLYKNGLVTREELLEQQDEWIERKVDKFVGTYSLTHRFHDLSNSRIEEHHDLPAARERASEFAANPSIITVVDDFPVSTNNAVRKFLVRKNGKVEVFADAYPEDAEEIESIMKSTAKIRVFFFDANDLHLSPESIKKLKDIMLLC